MPKSKWVEDIEIARKSIKAIDYTGCLIDEFMPANTRFEVEQTQYINSEIKINGTIDYPDIDKNSINLYRYYELFLSKEFPNGKKYLFEMRRYKGSMEIYWEEKNIELTCDYIGPIKDDYYAFKNSNGKELGRLLLNTRTFAGTMIWPRKYRTIRQSVNQYKGRMYKDRLDFVLVELERYYKNWNPYDCFFLTLGQIFNDYKEWYELFVDFNGFISFFNLQSFVHRNGENYTASFNELESYSDFLKNISEKILVRQNEFNIE